MPPLSPRGPVLSLVYTRATLSPMISIAFWLLSGPFTGAFVRTKREATPETFSLVLRFHFHWHLAHQILSICFRFAPHQAHIAEVEGKIDKRSSNHVSLLSHLRVLIVQPFLKLISIKNSIGLLVADNS